MTGVLVLAVAAVVLAGYFAHRVRVTLLGAVFLVHGWRWLTGNPQDGVPRTDAGWLRRGHRCLTRTGYTSRFWYKPRWQRACWRSGGTLGFLVVMYGLLADLALTLWLLAAALLSVTGFLSWRLWLRITRRRQEKTWLYPLHLAAHELAGHPKALRAASWITAELDGDGAVREARLALPQGWQADPRDEQRLVSIAAGRLGIESAEPTWRRAGPAPLLTLRHSPPPPGHVKMADLLGELESCGDGELLIGVGKNDSLIKASLRTDSPHIAISMGTGAGKSNLAGWLLFQMLLRGSIGMVLDAKRRLSYPWILKDGDRNIVQLPNVAYAWTTPQIHQSMSWLPTELDRRGDVAFAGMDTGGQVHANVGARLFVLAEELNLAVPRLRAYWSQERPDGAPAKSPAFTGLGDTAFAGRQVNKHLILVGQMLTAEATGSRDSSVKEQCGVKLMARYGPKGWRIMAEDIPMPPPPTALGRIQVVTGGQAREAQVPEFDPWEGRRLVLASDMTPLPHGMPCGPLPPVPALAMSSAGGPDQQLSYDTAPSVGQGDLRVTIDEAVRRGDVACSKAALRKASQRPGFPARRGWRGQAAEYYARELAEWDAGRR